MSGGVMPASAAIPAESLKMLAIRSPRGSMAKMMTEAVDISKRHPKMKLNEGI
jgi:hypothetical protein